MPGVAAAASTLAKSPVLGAGRDDRLGDPVVLDARVRVGTAGHLLRVVLLELRGERVGTVEVQVEDPRLEPLREEGPRERRRHLARDVAPFLLLHRDAEEDLVLLGLVVALDGRDGDVRPFHDLADLVLVGLLLERVDDLRAAREVDAPVQPLRRDRAGGDEHGDDRADDEGLLELEEVEVGFL